MGEVQFEVNMETGKILDEGVFNKEGHRITEQRCLVHDETTKWSNLVGSQGMNRVA